MIQSQEEHRQFWEKRYRKFPFEWGKKPSILAFKAQEYIPEGGAILDAACGYGRDAIFLARAGYRVSGMDFSEQAIENAKAWAEHENLLIDFKSGELINCGYSDCFFDGVTMFNTLHLLWESKRLEFISTIYRVLKIGGIGLFAFFSPNEEGYGVGQEVEKNTFHRGGGRIRHYFTREEIESLFSAYSDLSVEEFYTPPEEHEHHGRKRHGHHEWLVIGIK